MTDATMLKSVAGLVRPLSGVALVAVVMLTSAAIAGSGAGQAGEQSQETSAQEDGEQAGEDKNKAVSRMERRAAERMARLKERYTFTGETTRCVNVRRLGNSDAIDDETLFFKGLGKTAYVNRLLNKCPRLASEDRFAYDTPSSQLCRGELITVMDNFGQAWGSCAIGDFEILKKKQKPSKD